MNKVELASAVAAKTGLSKKDTEKVLVTILDTIVETMAAGEGVRLVGFGQFEVKQRAARYGRNPKTMEKIAIEPTKVPLFKPSRAFKEAVEK